MREPELEKTQKKSWISVTTITFLTCLGEREREIVKYIEESFFGLLIVYWNLNNGQKLIVKLCEKYPKSPGYKYENIQNLKSWEENKINLILRSKTEQIF